MVRAENPDRLVGVTPYLIVDDGKRAIEFYQSVLNAELVEILQTRNGKIGHVELKIAGGAVMLADEVPDADIKSPKRLKGSGVGLMIYVDDVDSVFNRAIAAGAVAFKPVFDQFYGDRSGTFEDPFGHRWTVSTRIEKVSPEELKRRFDQLFQ